MNFHEFEKIMNMSKDRNQEIESRQETKKIMEDWRY